MDRRACIDLPAFPLQLLLRREPLWTELPAAVVEQDKPQARILWLNEHARRSGILPGMRYAAGLALASDLCAGVVCDKEIKKGVALVAARLRNFSPDVEPARTQPSVFWLGASGLDMLYPSLTAWATRVRADLAKEELHCNLVGGFSRFGTYACTRLLRGVHVLQSPQEESSRVRCVPLNRLRIDPGARDSLHDLGVKTLGDLLQLPPAGLCERYGKDVYQLYRSARGDGDLPIQPVEAVEPLREEFVLDDGERNVTRLLFLIKRLLDPLLERLAEQRQALCALTIERKLERGAGRVERLAPAVAGTGAGLLSMMSARAGARR